ncbi:PTS sugar transporter subunit IIB [Rhodococcus erythropolis]|uniref:PTS sugar transporter subunit IIB n=1 Tax=Rhodococcus erythropolis TaxID=1833 RepID=UPI002949F47C|nr:PTS sugar transporter subunit IIB [Rhodococcus erythropolis]MDV6277709.1 PTS sugar transporter subunit IIB [Rhodococcus erythropolis]
MSKRILVICGTGVATSTVVAHKVRDHCAAQGIAVTVSQGKVMDVLAGTVGIDLVVATTQVPASVTVPVVHGLPFLIGIGENEAFAAITTHLRDQ